MIYFHKLGTKQDDDKLVYRRPDHPDWNFGVAPTDDGKYLVLSISAAAPIRKTRCSCAKRRPRPMRRSKSSSAISRTSSRSSATKARSFTS